MGRRILGCVHGLKRIQRLTLWHRTWFVACILACSVAYAGDELRVGVFSVDVSPPVGSPLAYQICDGVGSPITARGIVLLSDEQPIVLCALDWIGVSNGGYQQWRERLAQAVNTSASRVAVHTLHQHDAPRCDFSAEQLLARVGLSGVMFDMVYARDAIDRVSKAAAEAAATARPITHLGLGEAKVEKVASSRRILGPDGKIRATRYTACRDPELRAEPEGTIDPFVKSISLWREETPLVVLTYYATHPQSYYLTGIASPDFPGMARSLREATHNGLPHVHFNGAGGNIGAGKYNDGSAENRQVLATRLAEGMAKAFSTTQKVPINADDVAFQTVDVQLPVSKHLDEATLVKQLHDESLSDQARTYVAKDLVWLRRCNRGETIELSCLSLGSARILHMPGELAVEYQLAAQKMRPELFVAMAAYGEYAPGYICMAEHYEQGGYEAEPRSSKVSPDVEHVLMEGMRELLAEGE